MVCSCPRDDVADLGGEEGGFLAREGGIKVKDGLVVFQSLLVKVGVAEGVCAEGEGAEQEAAFFGGELKIVHHNIDVGVTIYRFARVKGSRRER